MTDDDRKQIKEKFDFAPIITIVGALGGGIAMACWRLTNTIQIRALTEGAIVGCIIGVVLLFVFRKPTFEFTQEETKDITDPENDEEE